METTKIEDCTIVLLDFSRSGGSDFDDVCIIVVYHFPQPFFNNWLLDFLSIVGSTSRLKSMRLLIFVYIVAFTFFKCFFYQRTHFQGAIDPPNSTWSVPE